MIFAPLKRVPVSFSSSSEIVEPSMAVITAFYGCVKNLPKIDNDADKVSYPHFNALRKLVCLYDNGKPFLAQLVNSLNEGNAILWPVTVLETDSLRQVLEALDPAYLNRIIEHFMETVSFTQSEALLELVRSVWGETPASKN
jgi:hypothetical protein